MRLTLLASLTVALWLLCLAASATADCCKPSKILFKLVPGKDHSCQTYGGKYHNHVTCEKKICGNGDSVMGTWCGRGKCNPIGCHCRNGNATENHGFFNFEYMGYA